MMNGKLFVNDAPERNFFAPFGTKANRTEARLELGRRIIERGGFREFLNYETHLKTQKRRVNKTRVTGPI
jgi:hypothetical protein